MSKPRSKPFRISKRLVWDAPQKVAANKGAAEVDRQSIEEFEQDLKGNLHKFWNRMSSGIYFPPPARMVEVHKSGEGIRVLGVPTVAAGYLGGSRKSRSNAIMTTRPFAISVKQKPC